METTSLSEYREAKEKPVNVDDIQASNAQRAEYIRERLKSGESLGPEAQAWLKDYEKAQQDLGRGLVELTELAS